MTSGYEPEGYWQERLASDFSLRGTGHAGFSPRYNDWVYRRKSQTLNQALSAAPLNARVLDIGSGVGWVVQQLLSRGMRVEGCDITDVAVDRLSKQYPGTEFFKAAVGSAPLPRDAASYDVVTMLDVAYHITDDQIWAAAVADVGRVLEPGGIFVITDRLADIPSRVSEHVQFRSRSQWAEAAAHAGMYISTVGPLYTWLSRPANTSVWRLVPDAIRGPVEYLRDAHLRQSAPHLRWAILTRNR